MDIKLDKVRPRSDPIALPSCNCCRNEISNVIFPVKKINNFRNLFSTRWRAKVDPCGRKVNKKTSKNGGSCKTKNKKINNRKNRKNNRKASQKNKTWRRNQILPSSTKYMTESMETTKKNKFKSRTM